MGHVALPVWRKSIVHRRWLVSLERRWVRLAMANEHHPEETGPRTMTDAGCFSCGPWTPVSLSKHDFSLFWFPLCLELSIYRAFTETNLLCSLRGAALDGGDLRVSDFKRTSCMIIINYFLQYSVIDMGQSWAGPQHNSLTEVRLSGCIHLYFQTFEPNHRFLFYTWQLLVIPFASECTLQPPKLQTITAKHSINFMRTSVIVVMGCHSDSCRSWEHSAISVTLELL
jgi:hypothetical protein